MDIKERGCFNEIRKCKILWMKARYMANVHENNEKYWKCDYRCINSTSIYIVGESSHMNWSQWIAIRCIIIITRQSHALFLEFFSVLYGNINWCIHFISLVAVIVSRNGFIFDFLTTKLLDNLKCHFWRCFSIFNTISHKTTKTDWVNPPEICTTRRFLETEASTSQMLNLHELRDNFHQPRIISKIILWFCSIKSKILVDITIKVKYFKWNANKHICSSVLQNSQQNPISNDFH